MTPQEILVTVPLVNGQWSYSFPETEQRRGIIPVSAAAKEKAGKIGHTAITFTVDPDPPKVTIASPATDSTISALPSVSGTASDSNSDLDKVRYLIVRYSDGKSWNGSSWVSDDPQSERTTTLDLSTGEWKSDSALPIAGTGANSLTEGSYDFIVMAYDTAGNSTRADTVVSVELPSNEYVWTGVSTGNNRWSDPANWIVNLVPEGNAIEISLRVNVTGYVLEATTDLHSGLWVLVPTTNGTATIIPTEKAQFFRLKK